MSLNKVFILGNLGADPELRYTQNGTAVCTFSVATTEYRTDRDGNRQETTEWHRIVTWDKQAQNCGQYLARGRKVFVEGKLQTRSWEDKQTGQKRYSTEIVAFNVQFVGGGASKGDAPGPADYGRPANNDPFGGQNRSSGDNSPSDSSNMGGPNLDEIPF